MLAGSLLEQAEILLNKGIHPVRIARGFEAAAQVAIEHLEKISEKVAFTADDVSLLKETAKTTLNSKILQPYKEQMSEIAVQAVIDVADLERNDVNFDMIRMEGKTGGSLEDTQLVNGLVLDKEFSHPQMPTEVKDAKLCILT